MLGKSSHFVHTAQYNGSKKMKKVHTKVLRLLKEGYNKTQIAKMLGYSRRNVYKILKKLREMNILDSTNFPKKVHTFGRSLTEGGVVCGKDGSFCRLHRVQLKIPIRQWVVKPVPKNVVNMGGVCYWQVLVGGVVVRVFERVLDCYLPSFTGVDQNSVDTQLEGFINGFIPELEDKLGVRVSRGDIVGTYKLVVVNRHYASVGNVIAKKYNQKKEKFRIFDKRGELRLLVDASLRVDEFEAVHPIKSKEDYKLVVEGFYNDLLDGKWDLTKLGLAEVGNSVVEMKTIFKDVNDVVKGLVENQKDITKSLVLSAQDIVLLKKIVDKFKDDEGMKNG